jgi:polysaccharide biosynthesis protein PslH
MRFLFIKPKLAWPRSSGHDVHCYYLMKAIAQGGHKLALATVAPVQDEAVAGLPLEACHTLGDHDGDQCSTRLTGLAERYRSYWGIPPGRTAAVARFAEEFRADCVVVVGLDVLPYLGGVQGPLRIWYAGDEWVWHHLSQVRIGDRSTWGNVREAALKGLYERAFANLMDRVWVVSEPDGRAMRPIVGRGKVAVVSNGVDSDFFQPRAINECPRSCVFWGRLDFGPNVQAIQWFCRRVWPALRRQVPDATFTIFGFNPTEPVRAFAGHDGVSLIPDLPDLRDEIARHAVVVLPFMSGGGIKNKLLEAAAMARPILVTPTGILGLPTASRAPVVCARGASAWVRELTSLWNNPERRLGLGTDARRWVITHHSWEAAASAALAGLREMELVSSGLAQSAMDRLVNGQHTARAEQKRATRSKT